MFWFTLRSRVERVLPEILDREKWVGADSLQRSLGERGIQVSFDRLQELMYRFDLKGLVKRCCREWGEAYRLT